MKRLLLTALLGVLAMGQSACRSAQATPAQTPGPRAGAGGENGQEAIKPYADVITEDAKSDPGVFTVNFPKTRYKVKRVRINLNTDLRDGWNEIDAVELRGPDGAAWASHAVASSNFGGS